MFLFRNIADTEAVTKFEILLTDAVEGGLEPFYHNDICVVFYLLDYPGDIPVLDGETLIFINWTTPRLSGLEFSRRLRCDRKTARSKITMILEDADEDKRKRAISAGADEIIIGPVNRHFILDIVMKRFQEFDETNADYSVEIGELSIDLAAFSARWKNNIIRLTPREFKLLRFFCENTNHVFTRQQIIRAVGQEAGMMDERTVDVWIGRLRASLARAGVPYSFRSVRGIGYAFDVA